MALTKAGGPPVADAPAAPEIPADAPADDDSGVSGGLDLIDGATLAFGVVVLLNILGLNPWPEAPANDARIIRPRVTSMASLGFRIIYHH